MSIEERLDRIERLIICSSKMSLSTSEAAIYLGISVDRIRHLVSEKALPYYKSGNRVYFARKDLDNYRLQYRVASNTEINEQQLIANAL